MSNRHRKFGALRDVHDVRDRIYRGTPRSELVPQAVYLREWGGPIKDQGEEGSCTGHAFSSAREWIARKYEKSSPILSPQCLYAEELLASNDFPKDEGAMPRTGCQVLTALGCCETALYPYVTGEITKPTPEQIANALKYKTGAYHRIVSMSDLLRCVADATPWPVAVGFTVYDSFMSDEVAETGIMPVPKLGEQQQGGLFHRSASYPLDACRDSPRQPNPPFSTEYFRNASGHPIITTGGPLVLARN